MMRFPAGEPAFLSFARFSIGMSRDPHQKRTPRECSNLFSNASPPVRLGVKSNLTPTPAALNRPSSHIRARNPSPKTAVNSAYSARLAQTMRRLRIIAARSYRSFSTSVSIEVITACL